MTDTASYADIVLPAASFLEYDDLTFSYFHYYLGAQTKISNPMGESLPNAEIFRRLAKRMKLEEDCLFESDKSLIDAMMKQTGMDLDFEDLKCRGYSYISEDVLMPYSDHVFETPSGKIEIASDEAEKMGLPRTPQPWVDEIDDSDSWRLLTPASLWRMNDSYANDPKIAERAGVANVHMNPLDAALLEVSNGSSVEIFNDCGSIELIVSLDDGVLPRTLVSYKGRWPSREPSAKNINCVHRAKMADMAKSSSVHSTQVKVRVI